jgi:methionyl-tRNA formyltransferase
MPAAVLERAVRAFNPAPGAWCEIAGERLKILAADVVAGGSAPGSIGDGLVIGTSDGGLAPTLVQRAGKPVMAVRDLLNGWTIPPGAVAA